MSSICSMRGMPSVTTDSTCVSPRWKRPSPCAVGEHADLGRERPEVGRAATVDANAFVDDAAARDFLLQRTERPLHRGRLARRAARARRRCRRARSSEVVLDLVERALRSFLSAIAIASAVVASACALHRRVDLGRVVDRGQVLDRLDRAVRLLVRRRAAAICRSIDAAIHCFDSSSPSAITSSVTFGAPSS